MNAAATLKSRAERRMGEELARAELKPGVKAAISRPALPITEPKPAPRAPTLAEIGISKDQSSRYQALAAIPEDTYEAAVEAHIVTDTPISNASIARVAHVGPDGLTDMRHPPIPPGKIFGQCSCHYDMIRVGVTKAPTCRQNALTFFSRSAYSAPPARLLWLTRRCGALPRPS